MKGRIMKPTKTTLALALAVVLLTLFSSGAAYAGGHGHGGAHFGVVIGGPLWFGPSYYSPYYYPPYYPPYAAGYYPPASPSVYVEQGGAQAAPSAAQGSYWYFCAEANGYYPYVKECPGGWQRVSPQPPPG